MRISLESVFKRLIQWWHQTFNISKFHSKSSDYRNVGKLFECQENHDDVRFRENCCATTDKIIRFNVSSLEGSDTEEVLFKTIYREENVCSGPIWAKSLNTLVFNERYHGSLVRFEISFIRSLSINLGERVVFRISQTL